MKSYKRNGKQHSPLTRFYEQISYTSTFFYIFFTKKKDISKFIKFSKELQLGLDRLIDNSRLPKTMQLMTNKRPDTSLTQAFLGKFGQFRYNMLGKRVNFSGRSVIITGPTLHLYQCQLPYNIALTLFMPHLMLFLKEKSPLPIYLKVDWEELIANQCFFFYKVLGIVIQKYLVMLNRAPTLHRFNIQSFNPILTLNKTISLHPLVCTGFNADFDGDQMAVHLPLYNVSQIESHMIHSPQVLTPANGDVILKPSQDIVIGSCY
jgi:DNA-directed RNA polymerase subunit beta'